MPATLSREHISFSYPPAQESTPDYALRFMAQLEQVLQRMEARIEVLQDTVAGLETRVTALENP